MFERPERRELHFRCIEEVVVEAERLVQFLTKCSVFQRAKLPSCSNTIRSTIVT